MAEYKLLWRKIVFHCHPEHSSMCLLLPSAGLLNTRLGLTQFGSRTWLNSARTDLVWLAFKFYHFCKVFWIEKLAYLLGMQSKHWIKSKLGIAFGITYFKIVLLVGCLGTALFGAWLGLSLTRFGAWTISSVSLDFRP